jgi:hypothetical protein
VAEKRRFAPWKLIAGGLGLALLALGLVEAGPAVLLLYAEWGIDPRAPVTAESAAAMRAGIRLLVVADDWFGDPRARIRAGLYELRLAEAGDAEGAVDRDGVARAVADLNAGLARLPADPLAWAALSDGRLVATDRSGAAAALKASILLGPNEPELALSRSTLSLALWPDLDAEGRQLAAAQLRLAWDRDRAAVLALARTGGNVVPVMIALEGDPTRFAALMKALVEHH